MTVYIINICRSILYIPLLLNKPWPLSYQSFQQLLWVAMPLFVMRLILITIIQPSFLNQAHAAEGRAPGFLKLFWFVCQYVCVCLPPRPLITNGMIGCDIDRVRLVKQVLQLFPVFNYFIRYLLSIKWMGVAILTQHVVNACQRKLR